MPVHSHGMAKLKRSLGWCAEHRHQVQGWSRGAAVSASKAWYQVLSSFIIFHYLSSLPFSTPYLGSWNVQPFHFATYNACPFSNCTSSAVACGLTLTFFAHAVGWISPMTSCRGTPTSVSTMRCGLLCVDMCKAVSFSKTIWSYSML